MVICNFYWKVRKISALEPRLWESKWRSIWLIWRMNSTCVMEVDHDTLHCTIHRALDNSANSGEPDHNKNFWVLRHPPHPTTRTLSIYHFPITIFIKLYYSQSQRIIPYYYYYIIYINTTNLSFCFVRARLLFYIY